MAGLAVTPLCLSLFKTGLEQALARYFSSYLAVNVVYVKLVFLNSCSIENDNIFKDIIY